MPRFLNVDDQPTYGIAICDRCKFKFPIAELAPDPNFAGLMVCKDDRDNFDPYREPSKQPDPINLPFRRSDVNMTFDPDDQYEQ